MNTDKLKASLFYIVIACVVLWSFVKCAPGLVAAQSPRGAETFAVSASVPLAWNKVEVADSYRVYYRRSGENYTRFQDAGTNLSLRVVGLERKTTYTFAATYRIGNWESARSNEVSYRTPFSPSDR